jgi:hypothetical protein
VRHGSDLAVLFVGDADIENMVRPPGERLIRAVLGDGGLLAVATRFGHGLFHFAQRSDPEKPRGQGRSWANGNPPRSA